MLTFDREPNCITSTPEAVSRGLIGDLNDQLTIIAGYSELVVEQLAPDDCNRMSLEVILRAVEQSSRIIELMRNGVQEER
jgi:hypothetical protein